MNGYEPQDDADRLLWRRFARPARAAGAGCPDELSLAAWLDGQAPPGQAEQIEAHLAGCPACLEAVIELRATLAAGPMLAPPQVVERAASAVARDRKSVV